MSEEVKFGFTAQQLITEGRLTPQDINLTRTWLKTQTLPKLTDEQIACFLLSCLNDQALTKTTIQAFYSVRNGAPELFDKRNIDLVKIQQELLAVNFCAFPRRTSDGCAVILLKFRDPNYSKFHLDVSLKLLFMTLDAAIYDHPPEGLVILVDMSNMGLMHLTKLKPGLVGTLFRYLQEGLPVRLRCIHVLNSPYFVNQLMAIIKPFAKKEVMEMIHFHPRTLDMDLFYKTWISQEYLPEDLGGDLPPIQALHEDNIGKLKEMQGFFHAEELQRHSLYK